MTDHESDPTTTDGADVRTCLKCEERTTESTTKCPTCGSKQLVDGHGGVHTDAQDDGVVSERTATGTRPLGTDADELVDRARDSMGELVLSFPRRIGGHPFARFTPYRNHRGVIVHDWTFISLSFEAKPGKTLRVEPHIVRAAGNDGYAVHRFSTPWVKHEARKSIAVRLMDAEETPFAGDTFRYTDEDGEVL
jgi:hypothetical protein